MYESYTCRYWKVPSLDRHYLPTIVCLLIYHYKWKSPVQVITENSWQEWINSESHDEILRTGLRPHFLLMCKFFLSLENINHLGCKLKIKGCITKELLITYQHWEEQYTLKGFPNISCAYQVTMNHNFLILLCIISLPLHQHVLKRVCCQDL